MKIRINCYDSSGKFKKRINNIKNINDLEFNEIMNGGQGNFTLELDEKFDCMDYIEGDFIEYIIFDEKNKKGLHKFSGIIKSIERFFNITESEGLRLEIQGLVSLLSDFKINKTYSGNLFEVVNQFINDFHNMKNISNNMQYLGNTIFKNGLSSKNKIFLDLNGKTFNSLKNKKFKELKASSNEININVSVNGTFFDALKKIFLGENNEFENERNFFINQKGEIILIQEITRKSIFTLNKNISEININSSGEIIINIINTGTDLQVGDFIFLQNINRNLNLNGKRVNELAFGIDNIVINTGKILNYKD